VAAHGGHPVFDAGETVPVHESGSIIEYRLDEMQDFHGIVLSVRIDPYDGIRTVPAGGLEAAGHRSTESAIRRVMRDRVGASCARYFAGFIVRSVIDDGRRFMRDGRNHGRCLVEG
jgi:hypothetical protein